jgi:hypothetical protein
MILKTLDIACLKQTGSIEFHHGRVFKIDTISNLDYNNLNKISVLTFFLSFFFLIKKQIMRIFNVFIVIDLILLFEFSINLILFKNKGKYVESTCFYINCLHFTNNLCFSKIRLSNIREMDLI